MIMPTRQPCSSWRQRGPTPRLARSSRLNIRPSQPVARTSTAPGDLPFWAMTCVGSKTRVWAYKYGADYLTPFFPGGDALSELSEYIEFSTQGSDIIASLGFIKKNPMPPDQIFDQPSSPRPAHATLPSGWHDAEVGYVTSASNVYGNPEASEMPSDQPSGHAGTGQAEGSGGVAGAPGEEPHQVNAEECTALEVVKRGEDGKLRCVDSSGKLLDTEAGKWTPCYVVESGRMYKGFSYMGKSGTQYYTWTLEPEGKGKKQCQD
jgi:hypothetical protein